MLGGMSWAPANAFWVCIGIAAPKMLVTSAPPGLNDSSASVGREFMADPHQPTEPTLRQQRILHALQDGVRTWDELRKLTKLNDDGLGFTIGELLNGRKIWTEERADVRVYGLERRIGLVPRFHPQRRASDLYA
jgi:hypothetical protein